MAAYQDPFDLDDLRIDPTDPKLKPRSDVSGPRAPKRKWERRFIHFPWSWLDRLKSTRLRATWALALLLIYEHWRTGGRTIKLTNTMAAEVGVSPDTKGPALDELEQAGLVEVERHDRKSPLVTLLVKPPAGHS
jgi:DNA-binding transcriptional ArsR family regulator